MASERAVEADDPNGEEDSSNASAPTARLEWKPLVSVPEEIEATLAAGFLESEGVACNIESRFFSQEPTQFALLGEFVLFVHEDSVDRARRLLEDRLDFPVEPQEAKNLDDLLRSESGADEEE